MLKRLNDETLRMLTNKANGDASGAGAGRKMSEVSAYKSVGDMPSTSSLAIQVRLDQHDTGCLLRWVTVAVAAC